jgi:hypothetical protein
MYRDTVFETCIKQRTYIVEEKETFFTDKEKNNNSLNLDLDTICRLDENNTDL